MGTRYSFTCSRCSYSAGVSGGPDAGMLASTTTICCADCRALYDVFVGHFSQPEKEPPRCPKRANHRVTRWHSGDPCPRCDEPLTRGEAVLVWD